MPKILNVIQILTLGGAARALIATAAESRAKGGYEHAILSLLPPEARALALAQEKGLRVIGAPDPSTLRAELEAADIVQMHWWNVPENTDFLSGPLPAMRLLNYYHVCGDRLPHIITPRILGMADFNVACNPYTFLDNPAFRDMDPALKSESAGMAYGAADFSRMAGFRPKPHDGFNVGYIGTVDFIKMHPDYVRMSASIRIPESRFIVCGDGSLDVLRRQAQELGASGRFDIRGYVEDVRGAIAEFDVYGYPLCEETYAGSELNLQEVMYAGVVPVVFPYGGVKRLVVNEFTGLIVDTAREYRDAVEHLYHHPAERRRMGANAKAYADQIFGAGNAAAKLNSIYKRLMERPKRIREPFSGAGSGSGVFLDTLGEAGEAFRLSREAADLAEALAADDRVAASTRVGFVSGILAYRGRYPSDPWLRYWAGLVFDRSGSPVEAANEFMEAVNAGFPHWRVYWRLMEATRAMGRPDLVQPLVQRLERARPGYREEIESARRSPGGSDRADWIARREEASEEPVTRAEEAFREGRDKEAESLLTAFLAQHPRHARALNDLGVVQHKGGRKDQARLNFLEALKADPAYAGAAANLSLSLRDMGLHQEALGLCYRYLDETPYDDDLLAASRQVEEDRADKLLARCLIRDLNFRRKDYQVTAIVSTYKSEAFMRECLEDLEGQSIAGMLEIVVVDADSPQGEGAIVEEFQRRYDNIRYIRTPERIGIYPAWNLAVRASSGAFITPFSTNDRLNPDAYRILREALVSRPDISLVYGDTYLTGLPHQAWGSHVPTPDYGGAFRWPEYSFEDLMTNCRVGPHPMWRREVHGQVGYFDGRYKAIGDQDFWLRMGWRLGLLHIPVFTGIAWITKESLSGESASMGEILEIQRKHTKAYLERIRRGRSAPRAASASSAGEAKAVAALSAAKQPGGGGI